MKTKPYLTRVERALSEIAPGLTLSDIQTRSRRARFVIARREMAKKLRGLGCSLSTIGRILGRHHSTVLHYLTTRRRR